MDTRKILEFMRKLKLQGVIKTDDGEMLIITRDNGSRLELIDAIKTEMLYDERLREARVEKMLHNTKSSKDPEKPSYVN